MTVPRRIASALINSLKGGVVPRVGLPYIAVGRAPEIAALLRDIDIIADGGASFRFVVGKYGSGKSFLMQTIRNYAMDRNFAVADADLSPERRLQGTKGQGLATYRELIRNMSTKTRPDGGALTLILDRWLSAVRLEAEAGGESAEKRIRDVVSSVAEMVHGFDFARLLTLYDRAHREDDDETKARVAKWFRGEYASKKEAKDELGVSVMVTDDSWYEYLKLFAAFLRKAGYAGLLVLVDELVNIYKIPNSVARQYNYEKILSMYNDALQGKAHHIGVLMGGTPQCVEDPRRGVYSYEALRSRLSAGRFSGEDGEADLLAPVIRLRALTREEMLVLAEKLAVIHADLFAYGQTLTQEDFARFITAEFSRVGTDANITPREIIRDFIEILNILFQNPAATLASLLGGEGGGHFSFAKPEPPGEGDAPAGEFAEFDL